MSSKGNILCRLINVELYKIFAITNRTIKGLHCIHISYHILEFVLQKKIRFTMEQLYMLPILYYQYHSCWCPGDLRSHGISRHGIEQKRRNNPSVASEELKFNTLLHLLSELVNLWETYFINYLSGWIFFFILCVSTYVPRCLINVQWCFSEIC